MKRVEAVIGKLKIQRVKDALMQIGVGEIVVEPYFSKMKIGVVVQDEKTAEVVATIEAAARPVS